MEMLALQYAVFEKCTLVYKVSDCQKKILMHQLVT